MMTVRCTPSGVSCIDGEWPDVISLPAEGNDATVQAITRTNTFVASVPKVTVSA